MKQPTAPDLYPELPIEDGQNYRLQKISEIENSLKNERDKRNSLYKKYKRGVNFTDGIDTTLISASVISAGIGVAIPILLPLQITAVACGSIGGVIKLIRRKLTLKAKKHYEIKTLAECKLNSIKDLISRSLTDNKISEEEFKLILEEQEKFNEMKKNSQKGKMENFLKGKSLTTLGEDERKKLIEETENRVFLVREDYKGNQILYVKDEKGNNIALTYFKKGVLKFYKFSTLQKEYGVNFVRDVLGVDDFKISDNLREARADFQDFQRTIKAPIRELDYIEIPLQEISTQQEGQELLEIASNEETHVKEIETSFIEQGTSLVDNETQTKMTKREMDGIISAMTSVKEEIANELAKLNETNKDLAKENAKLEQAKEDNDEFQIDRISSRIRELESERSARIETININREKLRSQLVRFKQTIHKMLNEDKTLGERIRTLFREQGITIVSVLTAFGMIIGVIVETFTGGTTSPSPAPSPSPPSKGGVQDWIKKQLKNLGKLLSFLAGKLAAALPGIIGSIVSWLLSATKDVVNWFANNLWALLILVVSLLFTAARDYLKK
ncbi:unnamed protein product [Mytilus edulis]|uniref:Uncharacterized protein n=1 Tax=Mytilus edulis TaxID=6550 RepID=A0A8S3RIT3_MYTED|nr:unnamed protein product [Mytilus edulis]